MLIKTLFPKSKKNIDPLKLMLALQARGTNAEAAAQTLGISEQSFRRRLSARSPICFDLNEVVHLVHSLNLSEKETVEIFFSDVFTKENKNHD